MTRAAPWKTPELRLLACLTAVAAILNAPRQVSGDTWFNLVLGREIVEGGLIRQNTLTAEGFGAPVVDLQWLAHLVHYALERALGIPGLVLVASVLTFGSLLALSGSAIRRGASPGRTLLIGALALASMTPQTVRAQSFAWPWLALCLTLLADDAERPRRRTWWLVPFSVVWANMHGSVVLAPTLAAALAAGRALEAWRRREPIDLAGLARDLLLVAALGAACLLTPYGWGIVDYYRATAANADFPTFIVEWSPLDVREEPATALLVAVAALLCLASLRRAPIFALLSCALGCALTLRSARHATPFALIAAALLPGAADVALGARLRFEAGSEFGKVVARLTPLVVVASLVAVPALTLRTLRTELPRSFTDRVAEHAKSPARVLSDEHHADRLLWYHPELRGRLSHHVRIEGLSRAFLDALTQAYGRPESERSRRWLKRYDLLIVDRRAHSPLWSALGRDPAWREVASDELATAFVRSRRVPDL